MAILSDSERAEVYREAVASICSDREELGTVTKAEFRAAVNAVDQWVSDNQSSFNTAIPQPARAQLTAGQKARLLKFVITKRFNGGVN